MSRKTKRIESLDEWKKETEGYRVATLVAIKGMVMTLLQGVFTSEDLSDFHLADQLRQIGEAIEKFGVTDAMIQKAVAEVRQELGSQLEDREAIAEEFSRILPKLGKTMHALDNPPEVRAMRDKRVANMLSGHKSALRIVEGKPAAADQGPDDAPSNMA